MNHIRQQRNFSIVILCSLFVTCVFTLKAAPYNGDVIELKQPDGTKVNVRFYGDEYYVRGESLDGYTVIRDCESGWIVYALLNEDASEFIASDIAYDHRYPTDPNHPSIVARMRALKRFENNENGQRNGEGPALQPRFLLNQQARSKKHQQNLNLLTVESSTGQDSSTSPVSTLPVGEPLTGSVVGLTVLVEFQDVRGTIPSAEIDRFCNELGYTGYGNNGSIRDYYLDISNGLLDYTNVVTDYILLDNNKSYYDDCSLQYGRRFEMMSEAFSKLCAQYGSEFFNQFTLKNGRVMALNFFYAGTRGCGWTYGLWPHKSYYSTSVCGTSFGDYQMTDIGTSLRMRTFCHENGHMICGWPDLYDYGYESKGCGNYDLMAYGGSNTNPVTTNPFFRYVKGWESYIDITNEAPGAVLQHLNDSFMTYQYINSQEPAEYFLIETCKRTGRRASMPDEGLLIWHIDENKYHYGANNEEQMTPELHYCVSVEQADGLFSLENNSNYGGSGDLFYAGYKDTFSDSTLPDAKWWSGQESLLSIEQISAVGETMSFVFAGFEDTQAPSPNPMTWATEPHATGSDSIAMTATTAQDASGVEYYFTCISGSGHDSGWQASPSYEDTGLEPETTYSYTVTARDKSSNQNQTTASTVATATTEEVNYDDPPYSDIRIQGVVSGSYSDTYYSDNIYESIQEVTQGHKFKGYSSLEHKWLFDIDGGTEVYFFIEAWHSVSVDGDEFTFAYSTNDVDYFNLLTVTKTVDDNALMSASLPSGISGTVYIRVTDTDSTRYNIEPDTLYVDRMFIRSNPGQPDTAAPEPNPMSWTSVPQATGSSSITMTATTAIDDSGVEYYFTCISGGGHDSGWQASPVYEDTGLQPNTTYTYTVKARDLSANQNETTASASASATTDEIQIGADCHVEAIDCSTIAGKRPKVRGRVMVTIFDDLGQPVEGAQVTGTFTGNFNETLSAITDSIGVAVFTTSTDYKKPRYTFTVNDVVHALPYDPSDNVETSDSY